jgi:hypothetical protein
MGGIFAPDDFAKWPRLDRSNPDYLIDLHPKGWKSVAATRSAAAPKSPDKPQL